MTKVSHACEWYNWTKCMIGESEEQRGSLRSLGPNFVALGKKIHVLQFSGLCNREALQGDLKRLLPLLKEIRS